MPEFHHLPPSTLMQVEFPPDVTCGEEVGLHLCITCVHTVLLLGHLRVAVTLFLNDNISTLLLLVARGCFVSQTPLLMTQTDTGRAVEAPPPPEEVTWPGCPHGHDLAG